MNYLEVELGGQKRGCKLGIGYLRFVTTEKKITLDEFFQSFQEFGTGQKMEGIYTIIDMLYYSLVYNCLRKKIEPDFDIDDVMDWVDEDGGFKSPVYINFINALPASFGVDLGKEKPQAVKAAKK